MSTNRCTNLTLRMPLKAPVINKESMQIFYDHLEAKPDDADIFVALDKDNHKNYPPVYFVACERDPLRDDGIVMESHTQEEWCANQA